MNIEHYWGAYAFAAGRGQIHIHMLAITKDQPEILSEYYNLHNDVDGEKTHVQIMSKYSRNVLELTADHPGYFTSDDYIKHSFPREHYINSLRNLYNET